MNNDIDLVQFLQNIPSFAEFGREELAALDRAMNVESYPSGYLFMGEETRAARMFLILQGEVIATHQHANPQETEIIERLGPGDLFGLVALIDHHPQWASYRAVQPVTAASLPFSAFELLFTAHAPIAHHFQYLIGLQLAKDLRTCANDIMQAVKS